MAYQRDKVGTGFPVSMRESDACIEAMGKMEDAAKAAGKGAPWRQMTTGAGCEATLSKRQPP